MNIYHNSSKATAIALYGMLVAIFALAGIIVYALQFHNSVPFSTTSPIDVVNENPVNPGDLVYTNAIYCINTTRPITLRRQVVKNSFRLEMPTVEIALDEGCRTIETAFTLPDILLDGEYYVEYTSDVQVNPLGKRVFTYRTEPFEVVCEDKCE